MPETLPIRATPAEPSNGSKHVKNWTPDQQRFIEWSALPRDLRQPGTHLALAAELGMNNATLSHWKHLEGFGDAVIKRTRELLRADDVSGILHSHAKLGRENVDSAKLVLHAANVLGDTHTDKSPTVQVLIVNQAEPGQDAIDAIAD